MKRKPGNIIALYAVFAVIAVIGYFFRHYKVKEMSVEANVTLIFSSFIYLILIWEVNRFIHYRFNKWIPFEKNLPLRIILQLIVAGVYMMILRFILINLFNDEIPEYVKNDSIILRVVYFIDFIMAISIHLAYISNYFFKQWKASLQKAERLEKEKTQVQFDNLKNQLNPHFLFNNLTLLDGLIHEQPELASKFLQHLSKVYRYVLQNEEKETVTLQTENEFINHYVLLMEMRFDGGLKITRNFSSDSLEKRIVPVTMQILIENAIKHNTTHFQKPLNIDLSSDDYFLTIKNNIQLKPQVESSNKLGLSNLSNLYKYLTKKNVEISTENNTFIVKVPLMDE